MEYTVVLKMNMHYKSLHSITPLALPLQNYTLKINLSVHIVLYINMWICYYEHSNSLLLIYFPLHA